MPHADLPFHTTPGHRAKTLLGKHVMIVVQPEYRGHYGVVTEITPHGYCRVRFDSPVMGVPSTIVSPAHLIELES